MRKISSILVVANHDDSDKTLLDKAVQLARRFGAVLELFACDAEHAYMLRRAYDTTGVEQAWLYSSTESREYLETLRKAARAPDVSIRMDTICDSPYCQAVVNKVRACRPDLVMKSTSGAHPQRRFTLDSNDWEVMRACPATLLLSRGKRWKDPPKFTAMADVSDEETPRLAESIIETAELLASGYRGELELVYGERGGPDAQSAARAANLQTLARRHHLGDEQVHVLQGNPEQRLAEFAARSGCDAIVLGALSHRKSVASLVGQLTGRLVEALMCDFVLVKPVESGVSTGYAPPQTRGDTNLPV